MKDTTTTADESINAMLALGSSIEGAILYYGHLAGTPGYEHMAPKCECAEARECLHAPGH